MSRRATSLEGFMNGLESRNPGQSEFHQAVREVAADVIPWMQDKDDYLEQQVLERLVEPDRVVSFRICWHDDDNNIRVNRGYRVQNSNAIGPYKGGLRFHPSVNESILKFLAFEQTFKNSLTGLPMGAGKGGSDFDPHGKSQHEVMRFCQALMTELYRYIGEDVDIPAGDIGVGAREIGYLFGQYKHIQNRFAGVLTGKGLEFGGSLYRTEATGYGCVYFLLNMLGHAGESLEGRRVVVSGAGNVALHAAEKALEHGGKVLTLSDSRGFVHDPEGFDTEKLAWVARLKEQRGGSLATYAETFPSADYHEGARPWGVECDVALPCATQNEITLEDARTLLKNGVMAVAEGANMPTDNEGVHAFLDARILFGPGKAANAGGVAMSGLEMSQNAEKRSWEPAQLAELLEKIMVDIHDKCVEQGDEGGFCNYARGANIAGFKKVADAMLAFGVV